MSMTEVDLCTREPRFGLLLAEARKLEPAGPRCLYDWCEDGVERITKLFGWFRQPPCPFPELDPPVSDLPVTMRDLERVVAELPDDWLFDTETWEIAEELLMSTARPERCRCADCRVALLL